MSLCLCNDACKRSLAICCKSRASCPVSRLLSVPIWPACAKQGRKYDSINILHRYHDAKGETKLEGLKAGLDGWPAVEVVECCLGSIPEAGQPVRIG